MGDGLPWLDPEVAPGVQLSAMEACAGLYVKFDVGALQMTFFSRSFLPTESVHFFSASASGRSL